MERGLGVLTFAKAGSLEQGKYISSLCSWGWQGRAPGVWGGSVEGISYGAGLHKLQSVKKMIQSPADLGLNHSFCIF